MLSGLWSRRAVSWGALRSYLSELDECRRHLSPRTDERRGRGLGSGLDYMYRRWRHRSRQDSAAGGPAGLVTSLGGRTAARVVECLHGHQPTHRPHDLPPCHAVGRDDDQSIATLLCRRRRRRCRRSTIKYSCSQRDVRTPHPYPHLLPPRHSVVRPTIVH